VCAGEVSGTSARGRLGGKCRRGNGGLRAVGSLFVKNRDDGINQKCGEREEQSESTGHIQRVDCY